MTVDYIQTTAEANVSILNPAFPLRSLGRTRRIWLYLPQGYSRSRKKYPVIYMHDGQNLFDAHTSYCGEWGVDKLMNTMEEQCIIVGIDNGGLLRLNEYNVFGHEENGAGEGMQFLQFVAEELKPFIDMHFRTKTAPASTLMAGSSMGGLISFYAGIFYPQVFGVLGIFSPSFWTNPQLAAALPNFLQGKLHRKQRYFFDVGGMENQHMITEMLEVSQVLKTRTGAEVKALVIPEGDHNEASWGMAFARFYRWYLGDQE